MNIITTELAGVVVVELTRTETSLGWDLEIFDEAIFNRQLKTFGYPRSGILSQDIFVSSKRGVIRGIDYQMSPASQEMLVSVIGGSAYHVVVDIRRDSITFGRWFGIEMTSRCNKLLWVPEGFAYGSMALEDNTCYMYKATALYSISSRKTLRWDDQEIGVLWPEVKSHAVTTEEYSPATTLTDIKRNFPSAKGSVDKADLIIHGDHRGSLIALEQGEGIPFEIKRAYYIFDTKLGVSRGFHAHYRLQQFIVCVSGKCRLVTDDGTNRTSVWLDSPTKALLVKNLIWREMHDFSEDCVLLVFASHHYDELDYIRNYDDFKKAVEKYE